MDERKAVDVLSEVKSVLDELKVQFWLESGTLLGAVRDHGFIAWDYDIDLGTSDKYLDAMPDICHEFAQKGFTAYYSQYNNTIGLWKDGVSIDFNFWRKDGNQSIMPLRYAENIMGKVLLYAEWIIAFTPIGEMGSGVKNKVKYSQARYLLAYVTDMLTEKTKIKVIQKLTRLASFFGNRRGLVSLPAEFIAETDTIEFYKMQFLKPSNVTGYLEYYFGTDWEKPRRDWDYVNPEKKVLSKTENFSGYWIYDSRITEIDVKS